MVTLIALPILTYPLGRDQGEFATIGRGLLNGRIPYQELWNPKPPAVFYVYGLAMGVFGQTSMALRALDLLMVPLIAASLYWLGKRIANPGVGLWAALLFCVFYFTESFWTLTQNDGIVLLPMVLAVVCVFKTAPHASPFSSSHEDEEQAANAAKWEYFIWPLLAGALCGYSFWFKYPFALFGAAVIVGYILIQTAQRTLSLSGLKRWLVKRLLITLFAFIMGGLVIVVSGAAYLAGIGALDGLVESARLTSQYTALTFNVQDFAQLMGTAISFRWQQWGLLWLLGAAWFMVSRVGEKRSVGWRVIVVWLLAGLAIMLVQAKGYDYHWLPMLPPLALLAADGLDRILQMLTRFLSGIIVVNATIMRGLTALGLLAILARGIWPTVWPYLTGQEDQNAYYHHFQAGEFVADESLQVASFLRERVVPGDSLFIWGFRPEVYYLSRLNPATRFIFQFPLVGSWYPAAWRKEAVDTLWAAMPPYVLVLQVDYMPWVTGTHDDSNTLLQGYTELNSWLIYNYERETQIGNFFIWRRKQKT